MHELHLRETFLLRLEISYTMWPCKLLMTVSQSDASLNLWMRRSLAAATSLQAIASTTSGSVIPSIASVMASKKGPCYLVLVARLEFLDMATSTLILINRLAEESTLEWSAYSYASLVLLLPSQALQKYGSTK
jgi:hypothetical protein